MMTRLLALVGALLSLLLVTGCGSGDDKTDDLTPQQALTQAKEKFDAAQSVRFSLSTTDQPEGGNGLLSATGVLTRQPAFEGEAEVLFSGIRATVPVTAVDGKIHAKLPMTSKYAVVDPADYGIPDPASFIDPDKGFSPLLTSMEGLKEEGQSRDGDTILTRYSGTVPEAQVKAIIPSAATGDYDTLMGIDDDGYLRSIEVTGPFYGKGSSFTYRVSLNEYDEPVTVAKP